MDWKLLRYRPLNVTQKEIRLVELQPQLLSANNHEFVPRLKTRCACLNNSNLPGYVALFYAWGDPKDTGIVLVEDEEDWRSPQEIRVSANLVGALENILSWTSDERKQEGFKRVLKRRERFLIWIDEFCIYLDRSRIKYRRNLSFDLSFVRGLILRI
jgi:hypothetical protein